MSAGAPADRAASPLRAAIFMIGAIFFFTMMGVAGRELAGHLTTSQTLFWRSLMGFAVIAPLVLISSGGWRQVISPRPGLHLLRNLGHFFGQNCWLYAVGVIPLAQVFALEFTAPIWVALVAPLVIGERFYAMRLVSAFFGFLGVLLVVRPDFGGLSVGQAFALAAAVGFAVNLLATKQLSRHESTLSILFWMTVTQAVMAVALDIVLVGWDAALPIPQGADAFWAGVVGISGLGAHFCVTSAMRWADATVVTPMDFVRLPVIAVVGATLYGEPLEIFVFLGGALIFFSNILNLRAGRSASPAQARTGDASRAAE